MDDIIVSIANEIAAQFESRESAIKTIEYLLAPAVDTNEYTDSLLRTVRELAYVIPNEVNEAINTLVSLDYTVVHPLYKENELDRHMTTHQAEHVVRLVNAFMTLNPVSDTLLFRIININQYPNN